LTGSRACSAGSSAPGSWKGSSGLCDRRWSQAADLEKIHSEHSSFISLNLLLSVHELSVQKISDSISI
jgi:hypothetical protein